MRNEKLLLQMVKLLEDEGYKMLRITIIKARKALGWTSQGNRYYQMLQTIGSCFSVRVNSECPLMLFR